jgi:hypothetical protein
MNIPIKSSICNGDNLNDISTSSKLKINLIVFSMIVPVILFLLFFKGLLKKNNPIEFLFVSNVKYVIISLLMFTIISLMVCFRSAIQVNNKRYKCNNLTSFNNKINNIEDEEKSNLEKILKEKNFNMDSLICVNDLDTYIYQDGYILKENKQTNNSYDGLLLFTYIVVLSLLIAFLFGIILNGEVYDAFDESTFVKMQIIFLWGMSIFSLASIIYPWALNENPLNHKKVNLITGLVSTILPSLLFVFLIIINYLID